MLKIGLTGGIGAGKTVVSDTFASLGITVIDTDIIARTVLKKDKALLNKLTHAFGNDILKNGQLSRETLREKAFADEASKAQLDDIMHPAIRNETLKQINLEEKRLFKNQQKSYCIIVVPLLIETGFIKLVDRVLVVTASHERKLEWLKLRSNLTIKQAEDIMQQQSTDNEKLRYADDHLINDNGLKSLQNKVRKLDKIYSAFAQNSQYQPTKSK